ncbi:amidohydrolase [Tardiphaga sp.]|uniref:amidohydrolase n=1 Tax=Tardiphaga sp. TaxID=1926292 RepID=UPI00260F95E5|nr:amidohydrolase [Tardiphaga sp.]MDB5618759.1 amidohydrolase [Tardiphaga sp.]
MDALAYLQRELPLLMSWRHDFHAHPEIGFQETRTAAKVAELLSSWGIEVRTGVGGTGVVGALRGRRPGCNAIGFRADMDALPMTGRAEVPYRSTRTDAFHGCGHDGHTSTLLGAAKYLSEHPDFSGTVYFIFQPAEETLRGGPAMIADGLFTHAPVSEVYGLHNNPLMAPGKIGIRAGAILSGCDPLRIEVHGVGAHGAQPHLGVDPIVVACELVGMLQTIVSRSLNALDSGVVSIGVIHGGTVANVIPDRVVLEGTIRSMSTDGRALLLRRVREICDGVANCFGIQISCDIGSGCPPTVNHVEQSAAVERAARLVVGPDNLVADIMPVMASEDFSFMLQERPGAYFFVGQSGQNCHHPEYIFDDAIMPVGGAMFVQIAYDRLNRD